MKRNNTKGMKLAAKERHRECEKLAHLAINELWARNEKITFVNVAKFSGVSRATLYNIVSVKKRIEKLKASKSRRLSDIEHQINYEQKNREQRLLNEISALKKENKEYSERMMYEAGLVIENKKLKEIIKEQEKQI